MELNGSAWDVVIAGTGLQESLLALSNKKILHLDRNRFYSGNEAALSLQEAEEWARQRSSSDSSQPFSHASVYRIPDPHDASKLGFARAYSLALAPQLLYARSLLLPGLVSSRIDNQLEFLAMGNWFTYSAASDGMRFQRVPSGREDLFASHDMTPAVKRSFVKLLRLVSDPEAAIAATQEHADVPLHTFLQTHFNLPLHAQDPIFALVMSSKSLHDTTTAFALPRIARHLGSIGVLGPGFGAVMPKWGGLSEIAQIGCRACAVGGAVYVLDDAIEDVKDIPVQSQTQAEGTQQPQRIQVQLSHGETVTTHWLAGGVDQLPSDVQNDFAAQPDAPSPHVVCRRIAVISDPLAFFFPPHIEGVPPPAGASVLFPASTFGPDDTTAMNNTPVHILVHTSETGECPRGQSVLYASTFDDTVNGFSKLDVAIDRLLGSESPEARVLWHLQFQQSGPYEGSETAAVADDSLVVFPPLETDLIFNDILLARVRGAWRRITGEDPADGAFLNFEPRQEEEEEAVAL